MFRRNIAGTLIQSGTWHSRPFGNLIAIRSQGQSRLSPTRPWVKTFRRNIACSSLKFSNCVVGSRAYGTATPESANLDALSELLVELHYLKIG
ncbi:MAG: hypothetical protein LBF88_07730 [Planctomycetaceae bacterium]|jgi:hypothetical protein|nr:hypothetical protein [Planctomycetaceae bacterium]